MTLSDLGERARAGGLWGWPHTPRTHIHTHTHTLLTHSLTVIIRPSETKRLRGFYSPLQRVQIIQLANVSDWVLDLIKCGLHTSAVVVRVSSRVGKHKLDWMRVEIKDVKMKVVQWASDIRRERLALLPHILENGEMRHTKDKLIKSKRVQKVPKCTETHYKSGIRSIIVY